MEVDYNEIFAGALNLGNPAGTFYKTHNQTGALTLGVAGAPTRGGWAQIVIIANTSAINVPAAWIKFGGDDISTTNAAANHLCVMFRDDDTIYYTNKVV